MEVQEKVRNQSDVFERICFGGLPRPKFDAATTAWLKRHHKTMSLEDFDRRLCMASVKKYRCPHLIDFTVVEGDWNQRYVVVYCFPNPCVRKAERKEKQRSLSEFQVMEEKPCPSSAGS
jgi:hypothetical protein